jgi:hypothetical protein
LANPISEFEPRLGPVNHMREIMITPKRGANKDTKI